MLDNVILLIAPPFSLSKGAIESLKNDFNFKEAGVFKKKLIEKQRMQTDKVTLVHLPSLKGLAANAESHTEKLYYFVYKYDEQGLVKDSLKNYQE